MEETPLPNSQESPKPPRVRDLFTWQSLSRPTLNYPKGTFLTLGSLVFLVTVIFTFFQEWLAIAVTWAAYFLFFALTKIPQESVEHKITTEGIISMNHAYLWGELGPFWFMPRNNELILHIANRNVFGHLTILINSADKEKIRDILAQYLPFIEVPEKSVVDKISDWFSQKVLRA
ncbi:hypothetical protein M1403_02515 [Patescibacteria group bacterium]|nr:hypothetical protein [Patescibacteria group bacterium]